MAANNISTEKVDALFFNRNNRRGEISGNIPSDHSVTEKGRRGRRTSDKVKIQDDVQFAGACYQFDTTKYLSVLTDDADSTSSSIVQMMNNKSWAISFMIKLDGVSNLQDIMSNNQGSTENLYLFLIDGKLSATLYHDSTDAKVKGNTSLDDGKWHSVILEYDWSDKYLRVYIDGAEDTYSEQIQGVGDVIWSMIRSRIWFIGRYGSGGATRSLTGKMYGIRLYDRLILGEDILDYTTDSIMTLTGEEEDPANIYDLDKGIILSGSLLSMLIKDADVTYSHLNKKGYNEYKGTFVNNNKSWRADKTTDWNWGQLCGLTDASDGLTDNFLMEFKVKWPKGLNNTGDRYIFRDEASYSPIKIFKYALAGVGNNLRFLFYGKDGVSNDVESVISNTDITDGLWHNVLIHVARGIDDDGETVGTTADLVQTIYIDGITDSTNVHESISGLRYDNSSSVFDICDSWDGYISDIKFYDATRVYTTQEVQSHIAGKPIIKNYCKAHFAFDKATNSTTDRIQGLKLQLFSGSISESDVVTEHYGASLTNPNQDIQGNSLEFKGELAPRLQLVNAPALSLNGTDQLISANVNSASVSSITLSTRFSAQGTLGSIISASNGSSRYIGIYLLANQELQVYRRSSLTTELGTNTGIIIDLNKWYKLSLLVNDDDSFILTIDETEYRFDTLSEIDFSELSNTLIKFSLGSLKLVSMLDVTLCDSRLYFDENLEIHYPLSEGGGSFVYDISGNDLHSEIINAVLPDIWVTQNLFHYSFYHGFNSYYSWNGSSFVILDTGWELANDWKVILRDVNVDPNITSNITLFTLNGSYYTYINVDTTGELHIGVYTSLEYTNVPIGGIDIFDGKSHTIEVIKSSTGDGAGNGVKVIFDDVDLGWIPAIADTTLDNVPESTKTAIGYYGNNHNQNLKGLLGDVEYYDINDNLIKKFTASEGYKDQLGLSPASSSPPFLIKIPTKSYNKDVLDKDLEFKGYADTGTYNGASDIQFPDIPEMPGDLKGKMFSQKEIEGLAYAGRILTYKEDMALFQQKVESIHFQRKGSRLILDDYPATCPSTALQKIQSDFTGTIITVRNEDNLQDADFGFDQYGRLPEADIIEHLNGTANGRVKDYYFQDVNHLGVGYTQSALSVMPYIAKNGVIQKDSRGLPALRFDGAESLAYDSQTAFKSMHDGTRGIQILGFQVDEDQDDFWVIGNTDFQGTTGFEFFGDAFNSNKLHFIIRTSTSSSAVQDLNIPMSMGKYNRVVNYIDPSNQVEAERHSIYVNELLREANTVAQAPNTGDSVDGTTSVGIYATRDMEGFINELIFIGDHKTDMLKFSRSLMFLA